MAFGITGIIIGIPLLVIGFFLVFLFPTTIQHQGEHFSLVGIVMGIIFLLLGGGLLFL